MNGLSKGSLQRNHRRFLLILSWSLDCLEIKISSAAVVGFLEHRLEFCAGDNIDCFQLKYRQLTAEKVDTACLCVNLISGYLLLQSCRLRGQSAGILTAMPAARSCQFYAGIYTVFVGPMPVRWHDDSQDASGNSFFIQQLNFNSLSWSLGLKSN